MIQYKLVYLNKGAHLSRDKDLETAQETLNHMIDEGWSLREILAPNDLGGALVAVLFQQPSLKEYKLVHLNKGAHFSRDKDLEAAQERLNQHTCEGWELEQFISPNYLCGALVVVLSRERRL